jgi:hypothetical protein
MAMNCGVGEVVNRIEWNVVAQGCTHKIPFGQPSCTVQYYACPLSVVFSVIYTAVKGGVKSMIWYSAMTTAAAEESSQDYTALIQ